MVLSDFFDDRFVGDDCGWFGCIEKKKKQNIRITGNNVQLVVKFDLRGVSRYSFVKRFEIAKLKIKFYNKYLIDFILTKPFNIHSELNLFLPKTVHFSI